MKQITNEEFASSTIANKMVLIKLGAEWCGPCHTIHPILEEIDTENEDITVFDIDIEEEIDLADELQIRTIPTLLFYKEGDLISRYSGALPKSKILEIFNT